VEGFNGGLPRGIIVGLARMEDHRPAGLSFHIISVNNEGNGHDYGILDKCGGNHLLH
jgi:hypothetical protein